jgi:flagellar basal body-associated protein FliL
MFKMKTGTKIALIIGGVVLIGGAVAGVIYWRKRSAKKQEEKRQAEIQKANEDYVPTRLETISAQEAGFSLSQNRPTGLAGVK